MSLIQHPRKILALLAKQMIRSCRCSKKSDLQELGCSKLVYFLFNSENKLADQEIPPGWVSAEYLANLSHIIVVRKNKYGLLGKFIPG